MQLYRPQFYPNSNNSSQKKTENNTSTQSYSQLTQNKNNFSSSSNNGSNITPRFESNNNTNKVFGNVMMQQKSPRIMMGNFIHQPQKLQNKHVPQLHQTNNQQVIHPFTSHNNNIQPSSLSQFKFTTTNNSNSSIFTPTNNIPSPFQIQTLVNAMNNSSLRQMSQGENIKPSDFMNLLTKAVQQVNRFSMLYQPKTQDLKHYFRIIQINQSSLFPQMISFSLMKSCSTSVNDRKKYQLLITLDGKELKFQSMNDRELHFNVNLDTVQCEFLEYFTAGNGKEQYSLKFRVGQKIIQIFINESCLPFHLRNDVNSKISRQYIQRSAKQIGKYMKRAIDKSRGAQFKLTNLLNSDPQYYKKNYATEQQFTQYCQTGDILLFKDRHTFAKIQRALTNSQYDHIAFVYRSQKYGICLIESSSGFGVSLTVWTHLVRKHWFRGIDTISWRRLLIHDKPNDYEKRVEDFITANKNKKYGISFSKLMTFQSSLKTEEEQKNRTYFCSQLVAQLYKQLGLLDQKVSSTQYWPKHFSQKGYLAMLHNSALDKQRILVFDQQVLKENYRGYQ